MIPTEKIQDRIRTLIAEKAGGRLSEFARLTGIDKATLSKILSGKREPLLQHMQTIEKRTRARLPWLQFGIHPQYHSADWRGEISDASVLTEGKQLEKFLRENGISWVNLAEAMGKTKATATQYKKSTTFRADRKKEILQGLSLIEQREVAADEVFVPMLSNSSRPMIIDLIEEVDSVPVLFVPVRARASFGYETYLTGPESERTYFQVTKDKLYPGTKIITKGDRVILDPEHCIVEINGDSMEPELKSGYQMLAYKIEKDILPKLGSIVTVDYRDEFLVKRLAGANFVDDTITLRSDNGGAEMTLPFKHARSIYRIYDYYKARL